MNEEEQLLALMVGICVFFCIVIPLCMNFMWGQGFEFTAPALVHDTTEVVVPWYVVLASARPFELMRATIIMLVFAIIAIVSFWKTKLEHAPITLSFLVVVFSILVGYHAALDYGAWEAMPLIFAIGLITLAIHLMLYYFIVIKGVNPNAA